MPLTFYDFPLAPSPRRARILLAEKQVPHETVVVDLAKGEQLGEAYRAINPACTVPALVLEDGTVLSENAGIAAYLEAAFPEPPLLGTTPAEKGLVAMWNARVEFEGLMAVAEALRNASPRMKNRALTGPADYAQIPELAERGLERIDRFFETLNVRLAGRAFLATENFSLADITAAVAVDFARFVKKEPGEAHGDLLRWRRALDARPSLAL